MLLPTREISFKEGQRSNVLFSTVLGKHIPAELSYPVTAGGDLHTFIT